MIVFPALDLMNGNVVKMDSKHHREEERIYGEPGRIADRWLSTGARWLHVIDLNSALSRGVPSHILLLRLLPKAAKAGAKIQWGGGVRDSTTLGLLMEARLDDSEHRIDRVIIGTRAVRKWDWLVEAAKTYPNRVVVAVDAIGLDVVVDGWQKEAGTGVQDLLAQAGDVSIAGFLYTNVAVEGRMKGPDWKPVEEVIRSSPKPVTVAGGVHDLDDIRRLRDLGAEGVVLGSALYSGAVDLGEAIAVARG